MVKATCPSCGAPGIVGKECEYCGTLIPKVKRTSKKKDAKNTPKKEMDDEDPEEFWEEVCPKGFDPSIYFDDNGNYLPEEYPSKVPYHIVTNSKKEAGIINLEGKFVKGPDHISYNWIFPDNFDYTYNDYFGDVGLSSLTTGEEFKLGKGIDWKFSKKLDANDRFLVICEDSLWTAIFDRRQRKLAKLNKPVLISECKLLDKTVNDYVVQFVLGRASDDNVTITIENDEATVTHDIFWEDVCPKDFMPYYLLDNAKESGLGDVSKLPYIIVANRENQKLHGVINREGQFVKEPEYTSYDRLFPDNYDYSFRNIWNDRLISLKTGEEFKLGRRIDFELSRGLDIGYRYLVVTEDSHWTAIFDRHNKKIFKFSTPVPVAYKPTDKVRNGNVLQLVFAKTSKDKMTVTIDDDAFVACERISINQKKDSEEKKKPEHNNGCAVMATIIFVVFTAYFIYCCHGMP